MVDVNAGTAVGAADSEPTGGVCRRAGVGAGQSFALSKATNIFEDRCERNPVATFMLFTEFGIWTRSGINNSPRQLRRHHALDAGEDSHGWTG